MHVGLVCPNFARLGGKERDCLAIGRGLIDTGAKVTLFTALPPKDLDPGIDLVTLKLRAMTNHGQLAEIASSLSGLRVRYSLDRLIGFEPIPGVNFYYGADVYRPPAQGVKKWLPRYQTLNRLAAAAFSSEPPPFCFFLTVAQASEFARGYALQDRCFKVLPPVVHKSRLDQSCIDARICRRAIRASVGLPKDSVLAIAVATSPVIKGVKLAIEAVAGVDNLSLLVVGPPKPTEIMTYAERCGVTDRVRALSYREDIMRFLSAADVLLHPAQRESAGQVIIESLIAGTPVLVTNNCGYAPLVADSGSGICLPTEPTKAMVTNALRRMVIPSIRTQMTERAFAAGAALRLKADDWLTIIIDRVLDSAIVRECAEDNL